MEDQMNKEEGYPSYWNSVIIASLITALIYFVFSLIGGYMTINAEPTGNPFGMQTIFPLFSCLFAAAGGIIVNWHYAKQNNVTYKMGKGALLGLLTGVVATVVSFVLGYIWEIVDPSFTKGIIDSTMANMEAMQGITQDMLDQTQARMDQLLTFSGRLKQSLWGLLMLGVVNAITGLIGAKIFASEEE